MDYGGTEFVNRQSRPLSPHTRSLYPKSKLDNNKENPFRQEKYRSGLY